MIWESAGWLWLLWLVPLLIVLSGYLYRVTKRKRERYFSDELFKDLLRNKYEAGHKVYQIFLYTGLVLLILALAGPKIGTEVREVKREGVNLLIALDLSLSMKAEDVRTNRLEKAKFEIGRIVDHLEGDRVGLIVFTGEAHLQSPLTLDYSAFRTFLDIADTGSMPTTSTDFSSPLSLAHQSFSSINERTSNSAKVLLMVSDGEDHGRNYSEAYDQLVDSDVLIYTVGIGTEEGGNIPAYDEQTGELQDLHRDRSGKVVTTRLEPNALREMAENGGGSYYEIARSAQGVDNFINKLTQLERGEFAIEELADYKNQYQYLAFLGLLCLIISLTIPKYKAPK
ncbi:MAG: VWA domain-containing protein [Balneolales bacterium]